MSGTVCLLGVVGERLDSAGVEAVKVMAVVPTAAADMVLLAVAPRVN